MEPEQMTCTCCSGAGCDTCAGDGVVPVWLADPNVVGEDTARSWGWSK